MFTYIELLKAYFMIFDYKVCAFLNRHSNVFIVSTKIIGKIFKILLTPYLCKPFGIFIKFVGIICDRSHFIALGHYLIGTGRDYFLSEDDCKKLIENCDYMRSDWYEANGISGESDLRRHDLYNTVGKFRIRRTANHFVIYDIYQFYATCGSRYGRSEAKQREEETGNTPIWGNVRIKIELTKILSYIKSYGNRWRDADDDFNIEVSLNHNELGIDFCDRIFSTIGKPFQIRGRIEKCKIDQYSREKIESHYSLANYYDPQED